MNKLQAMEYFLAVAERGNFSQAAQQYQIDRSVITRTISALEQHLGTQLFHRSTRKLTLTSTGEQYLEAIRPLIKGLASVESHFIQSPQQLKGHLKISLPLSFGLTRLKAPLISFAKKYPEIELNLHYSDDRLHQIEEGIDLSIRLTRHLHPTDVIKKLGEEKMRVVASPAYLQTYGIPPHPSLLMEHFCLEYAPMKQRAWEFLIDGHLERVPVPIRLTANNGELLTEAAIQGLGITVQPDFIVEAPLKTGQLIEILKDYPLPTVRIYCLFPSYKHISPCVQALVAHLETTFQAN